MKRCGGRGCLFVSRVGEGCDSILWALEKGRGSGVQVGPQAGKRELWAHEALTLKLHASNYLWQFPELKCFLHGSPN